MKNLQLNLSHILVTILSIYFVQIPTASAEKQPWRIGILAPLSGDAAVWGTDTQRAVSLANEMLGKDQFELVFEDDRCLGKNAVDGAQKLVNVDHVQFGMIVCTEPTLAAAPVFEKAKIVVVAPGATGAAVTNAGDYIFRTWPSDAKMVELLFNYAQSKYKKMAVITEMRGFPQEFTRVLLDLSKSSGTSIAHDDFASGETDFRSLLTRIKNTAPDALVVSTDSERTLLEVVKQLSVLKWRPPLLSQYIAGTPAFYEKAGGLADGLVFGDSLDVDCSEKKPGCDVFLEFKRRYGTPQSSPFMVASSIASFMAIAEAARSGKDPKDYLYSAKIQTPVGSISFDKHGDVVGPVHTLKVIRNGKPEILKSTSR